MKKLDTAPYKGVRDFYPEDQFIQNHIQKIWRETVESFGYSEYGASILEPSDIYKEKSGEEIVNEQTYTFTDRGEREVTLRPEMTPTVARMVAQKRRELAFPLRWYSIPNLFRYESPQRGRLREHWQLNVDLFGVDNIYADLEIIEIAHTLLINFGATNEDFEIRMTDYSEDGAERLEELRKILEEKGITNTLIDPKLKRGQAYYTGIVFEIFDTREENNRSILGGGRFDNLLDLFGGEKVPAVGFGAGDVIIRDFLEVRGLLPEYESVSEIYIAVVEDKVIPEAMEVADEIRGWGLDVEVDLTCRKVGDQLKSADKKKIPMVIVIGQDEAESKTYKLKDMKTGEERVGSLDSLKLELLKS